MIKAQILSPESSRTVEAQAVFLPGSLCPFEVLPGHAPIISSLDAGAVRWRTPEGGEESLEIKGGVVRLEKDVMQICVEL